MVKQNELISSLNYASTTLKISSTILPVMLIVLVINNVPLGQALFMTAIPLFSNIFYWFETYTYNLGFKLTPKPNFIADKINEFLIKVKVPKLYLPDFHRTLNILIISLFLIFECQNILYTIVAVVLIIGNVYSILYKYISLDDMSKQVQRRRELRLESDLVGSCDK